MPDTVSLISEMILCTLHRRSNSCIGHVVNIATQQVVSVYSKTPHFDPEKPETHLMISRGDDLGRDRRDIVGLIRVVCVKVRIVISLASLSFNDLRAL